MKKNKIFVLLTTKSFVIYIVYDPILDKQVITYEYWQNFFKLLNNATFEVIECSAYFEKLMRILLN